MVIFYQRKNGNEIFKNRTVLGVVCIALSLIICFAITPLFNASKSSTMKIVRIKNDLPE